MLVLVLKAEAEAEAQRGLVEAERSWDDGRGVLFFIMLVLG
jgi:hypothetical protein